MVLPPAGNQGLGTACPPPRLPPLGRGGPQDAPPLASPFSCCTNLSKLSAQAPRDPKGRWTLKGRQGCGQNPAGRCRAVPGPRARGAGDGPGTAPTLCPSCTHPPHAVPHGSLHPGATHPHLCWVWAGTWSQLPALLSFTPPCAGTAPPCAGTAPSVRRDRPMSRRTLSCPRAGPMRTASHMLGPPCAASSSLPQCTLHSTLLLVLHAGTRRLAPLPSAPCKPPLLTALPPPCPHSLASSTPPQLAERPPPFTRL